MNALSAVDALASRQTILVAPDQAGHHAAPLQALADRALQSNIFFDPAVVLPAFAHIAPKHARLLGVCDREGTALTAAWPIIRAHGRYGPLPTPVPMAVWHHPYSMLGTPLIASDAPSEHLAHLLAALQKTAGSVPVLYLQNMPMDGPLWPLLEAALQNTGRRLHILQQTDRAGLTLSRHQNRTIRGLLGAKSDRSIQASIKRLKALGTVDHHSADSEKTISSALDQFLVLEASGWKGQAGTALLNAGHGAFMHAVARKLVAQNRVRVDLTRLNGTPIAGTLSIRSGDPKAPIWMPWKTGFQEAYIKAAPGSISLYQWTKSVVAQAEREGTDLSIDSLATATNVLANRLWRDRVALADVLIDLKPGGHATFPMIVLAEKARAAARQAAHKLRKR